MADESLEWLREYGVDPDALDQPAKTASEDYRTCVHCQGTGESWLEAHHKCPICKGSGLASDLDYEKLFEEHSWHDGSDGKDDACPQCHPPQHLLRGPYLSKTSETKVCPRCEGTGDDPDWLDEEEIPSCSACQGAGTVSTDYASHEACGGRGCSDCRRSGLVPNQCVRCGQDQDAHKDAPRLYNDGHGLQCADCNHRIVLFDEDEHHCDATGKEGHPFYPRFASHKSSAKTRLVMPAICPSCQSTETRGRYHRGGWREYSCLDCGTEFKNRDSRVAGYRDWETCYNCGGSGYGARCSDCGLVSVSSRIPACPDHGEDVDFDRAISCFRCKGSGLIPPMKSTSKEAFKDTKWRVCSHCQGNGCTKCGQSGVIFGDGLRGHHDHGVDEYNPKCPQCQELDTDHAEGHSGAKKVIEHAPQVRRNALNAKHVGIGAMTMGLGILYGCFQCLMPSSRYRALGHLGDDKAMHHANPDQLRADHPYWDECQACGGDGITIGNTDVLTGEQKQAPCKECSGIGEAYDAEYWESDDQLHDFANYPNFKQMKIPDKSMKDHIKDIHPTEEKYDDAYVHHQGVHGINVDPKIVEVLLPKAAGYLNPFPHKPVPGEYSLCDGCEGHGCEECKNTGLAKPAASVCETCGLRIQRVGRGNYWCSVVGDPQGTGSVCAPLTPRYKKQVPKAAAGRDWDFCNAFKECPHCDGTGRCTSDGPHNWSRARGVRNCQPGDKCGGCDGSGLMRYWSRAVEEQQKQAGLKDFALNAMIPGGARFKQHVSDGTIDAKTTKDGYKVTCNECGWKNQWFGPSEADSSKNMVRETLIHVHDHGKVAHEDVLDHFHDPEGDENSADSAEYFMPEHEWAKHKTPGDAKVCLSCQGSGSEIDGTRCEDCNGYGTFSPKQAGFEWIAEFTPGDTTYPFAENATPKINPIPRYKDPWVDQGDTGNPDHNPGLNKLKRKMVTDEQSTGFGEVNSPGNGLMSEASSAKVCIMCKGSGEYSGGLKSGRQCYYCKGSGLMINPQATFATLEEAQDHMKAEHTRDPARTDPDMDKPTLESWHNELHEERNASSLLHKHGGYRKEETYSYETDDGSHKVVMSQHGRGGCTCGWTPPDHEPSEGPDIRCHSCKATGLTRTWEQCGVCEGKGSYPPEGKAIYANEKIELGAEHIRDIVPKTDSRKKLEDHFAESHGHQLGSADTEVDPSKRGRHFAEYFITEGVLNRMHEGLHDRDKCNACKGTGACTDDLRSKGKAFESLQAQYPGKSEQELRDRLAEHTLCGGKKVCFQCEGSGHTGPAPAGHEHEGIKTSKLAGYVNCTPCKQTGLMAGDRCPYCKGAGVRAVVDSDPQDHGFVGPWPKKCCDACGHPLKDHLKIAQTWTQGIDTPQTGKRPVAGPHLTDGETHILELNPPSAEDIKKWKTIKTFPGDKPFAEHPTNQDHVDLGQVVGSKRFKECSVCGGTGIDRDPERSWTGDNCENCLGSGISMACEDCGKELFRATPAHARLTGEKYFHSSVDRPRCTRYSHVTDEEHCEGCHHERHLGRQCGNEEPYPDTTRVCKRCQGNGQGTGFDEGRRCEPCKGSGISLRPAGIYVCECRRGAALVPVPWSQRASS